MNPPLHEIVLAYSMNISHINGLGCSDMMKLCQVVNLFLDTGEELINNCSVTDTDMEVFKALNDRYFRN